MTRYCFACRIPLRDGEACRYHPELAVSVEREPSIVLYGLRLLAKRGMLSDGQVFGGPSDGQR